jgi:hypothetical protein
MKKLILILAVLVVFAHYASAAQEINITRDLSGLQVGKAFNVVLDLKIKDSATAVAIEEYVPEGASIIDCSESEYRVTGNKLEILLFSPGGVISKEITYSVVLNSNNGIFSGNWSSVSPYLSGSVLSASCGDNVCDNGETCNNCPVDCSVCPETPSSSSGESSSGSSGGGSGSRGSSAIISSSGSVISTAEMNATGSTSDSGSNKTEKSKTPDKTGTGSSHVNPVYIIFAIFLVIFITTMMHKECKSSESSKRREIIGKLKEKRDY